MSDFMDALRIAADSSLPNVSVTENGAVGYKTAGKKLVDCNFMLSSMRNMRDDEIWSRFLDAYNENPVLAVVWLFFARDCHNGCGERRTFRVIFGRLCRENPQIAFKLLPLIPFYGRWDDLIDVFCGNAPIIVKDEAIRIIGDQLRRDLDDARAGKPVSLLAKWTPSINTHSSKTRARANKIRSALNFPPKASRRMLSVIRAHIDVVERKMSANEWGAINYETVPSRAAMTYRDAFARHDGDRYEKYLTCVKEGKAKIHAGVLFPYDIVHAYSGPWGAVRDVVDATLEEQWKALPDKVKQGGSTLVVVDGSGSMNDPIGNTQVTCHDVARSLGVYFAERLTGAYRESFITFSANPQFIHFADGLSLNAKLKILEKYDECSNTDIEKVFDLVLNAAIQSHAKQDEIPSNILIVSDQEYDSATERGGYGYHWSMGDARYGCTTKALFDSIRERWEMAGYEMPRLVFWNVCSRTGTIPVTTNDRGVALVSGFSPNIADMVMGGDVDPYECLVKELMSERYSPVFNALKG